MALSDYNMIHDLDDTAGLLWHDEVQAGKYYAELQTGIVPQIVHLIIFDMENNNEPVYNAVQAFNLGDTLDDSAMSQLQVALAEALAVLNA